jgi:4-hydroxy-4-methyl-2-oxoglutarate aldolase
LEFVAPGDVLVVQVGGLLGGYWGEILSIAAQHRGVAGLVIDGGVRDTQDLEALLFPVFARGAGVFRTVKHEAGELQASLVVGGVVVNPGDIILGDADGVMAVARERVSDVLEAARKRQAAEQGYIERIHRGELTMDIYGFRKS